MTKSEQINELVTALSLAQGEISGAVKESKNGFFKSSYADLAAVMDAIRKPFLNNGLSYSQTTRITDGGNTVLITTLFHKSGQLLSGEYPVGPTKNDPQSLGSAMTYARRYALSAIAGVAQVDDDGEAAMNRGAASSGGMESNNSNKKQKNNPHANDPLYQMADQDGHQLGSYVESGLGDYVMKFGKHKGTTFGTLGVESVRSYLSSLERLAKKDGKALSGDAKDFKDNAEAFIKANSPDFEESIPF